MLVSFLSFSAAQYIRATPLVRKSFLYVIGQSIRYCTQIFKTAMPSLNYIYAKGYDLRWTRISCEFVRQF